MYYTLASDLSLQAGFISRKDNQNIRVATGVLIDESRINSLPWPFEIEPDLEEGLVMSDLYDDLCLMSKRMLNALTSAGVDTLQTFPAVITNTQTGEQYDNYVVYNIIGLVSCIDQDNSTGTPLANKQFFTKLAIDKSKTRNLKLFRVEESLIDVLIHESVAKTVKETDLTDVAVKPVV